MDLLLARIWFALYEWGPPSEVGGGWEGTVPLVSWNKWPFSHVPQKQNLDFLWSLFPKTGFVPLIFGPLFPCSPEKYALVPLFPKTPWSASLIVYNPGNAFSEARLATLIRRANWWTDGFTFSFNVEWIGLLNGTSTVASVQHTTCDYTPSIISEVLTRWKLFIPYLMTGSNNYFTTYCLCHIFRSMFYLYHHRSRYETPQYKYYLVIISRP